MDKEGKEKVSFDGFLYKVRNLGWLLDPVEAAKYKSQLVQKGWRRAPYANRWNFDWYSLSLGVVIGATSCLAIISQTRKI